MGRCVLQERVEHHRAGAAAACPGRGRHAAHAPRTRAAVGHDKADGDKLITVERPDGESAGRLVCGHLLDGLMGT